MFNLSTFLFRAVLLLFARLTTASSTILPTPTMTRKEPFHSRRTLSSTSTEECDAAMLALYNDHPSLQEAAAAFTEEYDAAIARCGNRLTCSIDENSFAASPNFVQQCHAVAGAIYEYDFSVSCQLSNAVTEDTVHVQISYLNVDYCFDPTACTDDAIAVTTAAEANQDLALFEQVFTSGNSDTVALCNAEYAITDAQGNLVVTDKIDNVSSAANGRKLAFSSAGLAAVFAFVVGML